MTSKLIRTRLGDIEFCSVGRGTPILFFHGGHSNCNDTLCHKGFELEKFQLITPSRPGYGRTSLNNNRTPKQAAELIMELVKYLALDNVIVYGVSAGGLTAIEFAGNYQDKVQKLILASAISKKWLDEHEKIYKIAKKVFNPRVEKITWGAVRLFSRNFPNLIAMSFYPHFSKKPLHKLKKDDVKEFISSIKKYNSKSGFLNDIEQSVSDQKIRSITCPTLIIHSECDNSVSFEHAENANTMIKNSRLEPLQNEWGHLFWIGSDSKEAITKIIEFI